MHVSVNLFSFLKALFCFSQAIIKIFFLTMKYHNNKTSGNVAPVPMIYSLYIVALAIYND